MYIDKGPEYWAGWALAFFQWQSRYTFMEILTNISLEKIIAMYPSFHEMDIQQFADRLWDRMAEKKTNLRMRREACGLSQSELAAFSRVPLRQIQLFEQLRRNINKTASETLLRLSRALSCSMEDLMEKQDRLNNG